MMARTSWTIEDALPVFKEITAQAREYGFFPAIFGSVARTGAGRDLDLYMVHVPHWSAIPQCSKWLEDFGGTIMHVNQRPDRTTRSWEILREGRLYHFVFAK
ncbi:MAG: hypothetical protein P4K78_10765 [Terracidiphilus sp.]|nr:hypothetical protein [Terracidiphilus sp.]